MKYFLFFFVVLSGLSSCGDSHDDSLSETPSGEFVNLQVALPTMDGFATSTRADMPSASEVVAQTSIELEDGLMLDATLEKALPGASTRATAPLPNNVYFRVVMYSGSVSVGNYKGHADYRMVNGAAILQTGRTGYLEGTYQIVCYTYSETTPINDGFNGTSVTLPNSDINNKDFLYYTVNKNLTKQSPGISVNFAHMYSRMQMELDVSGAGTLVSFSPASLSGSFPAGATMTLGSSGLSSYESSSSYSFTIPSSEWSSAVCRSNYNLVAPSGTSRSLTMNLPAFTMNLFGEVKSYSNKSVTFSGVRFTAGATYFFRVNVVALFILQAEGKRWRFADSGLIYNPNLSGDNRWYVKTGRRQQGYCTGSFSGSGSEYMYFTWNALYPDNWKDYNSSSYSSSLDPCCKLGGNWQTPSKAVLQALCDLPNQGGLSYTLSTGTTVKGCYFGINTQPSVADQDRYLFFPASGSRFYTSTTMVSVGTSGNYWSSDVSGTSASSLYFSSSTAGMYTNNRSYGFAVRCSAEI